MEAWVGSGTASLLTDVALSWKFLDKQLLGGDLPGEALMILEAQVYRELTFSVVVSTGDARKDAARDARPE